MARRGRRLFGIGCWGIFELVFREFKRKIEEGDVEWENEVSMYEV